MCSETFQLTSYEVLGNDTTCTAVNQNNVKHFITSVQLHSSCTYLAAQCRICTQQQLLTSLTFCIESTRNLCTTE